MKKSVIKILTSLVLLTVLAVNGAAVRWDNTVSASNLITPLAVGTIPTTDGVGVSYATHVQNLGWETSWASNGSPAGTEGRSLRLEGIRIKLTGAEIPAGGGIEYRTHVQNIGWEKSWAKDGATAGTEGQSLRLEAIEIRLVNLPANYSVEYRTHVQNIGWETTWAKNGEPAGTEGRSLRLEAIEIRIVKNQADLSAYAAALKAVNQADYTASSWAAYQQVVAANVVTADDLQTRVDQAVSAIVAAQSELVKMPVINSVAAVGQKNIELTGENLGSLMKEAITLPGNTVAAITVSGDGTTAIVTLGTDLPPELDVKVTIKTADKSWLFTVNYTILAQTAEIVSTVYDNDWTNQKLVVLVNGVETTTDYLQLAGYGLRFYGWDEGGNDISQQLFGNDPNTDGYLNGGGFSDDADLTVQVILSKGAGSISSAPAEIKIRDLDNNATAINDYLLRKTSQDGTVDFLNLNNNTLVVGEYARVASLLVSFGEMTEEIRSQTGYQLSSSDTAVIAIDSHHKIIKAVGAGTSEITLTVGPVSKTFTIMVATEQRVATTIMPEQPALTYVIGGSANTMLLRVYDQYGDPFVGNAEAVGIRVYLPTGITGFNGTPILIDTSSELPNFNGEYRLALAGATTGGQTGVAIFRNRDDVVVGSFNINTTVVNNGFIRRLEYDDNSETKADTIDFDRDSSDTITFKIGQYTTEGIYNGDVASLSGYRIMFNGQIINLETGLPEENAVGSVTLKTGAPKHFVMRAKSAGTTDMAVFDASGNLIDKRQITVNKNEIEITGITWRDPGLINYPKTINYRDVLSVTPSYRDDLVKGVTLSLNSTLVVRIDEGSSNPELAGNLYLDRNGSGFYEPGADTILGSLSYSVTGDALGLWTNSSGNGFSGQLVQDGDQGLMIFRLSSESGSSTIATMAVSVNLRTLNLDTDQGGDQTDSANNTVDETTTMSESTLDEGAVMTEQPGSLETETTSDLDSKP
ncbi:hypothetical protein LNN31_04335 [Acetobacterium wieringae]|uniref:Clostridial hydrophobic W n=1 Tax=Acetobacterium wieringae TaxID=52694 RepID=A0ABY6HGI9_9FIRM|nr:hypothetical protein [Acetobacterium wieringae]UYO63665.1 hypothetical protein LNN31_04335 [Acetobacterium wieringae]